MPRKKTVHYLNGCAYASGELQQADTDQTTDWKRVDCRRCLRKRPRRRRGRIEYRVVPDLLRYHELTPIMSAPKEPELVCSAQHVRDFLVAVVAWLDAPVCAEKQPSWPGFYSPTPTDVSSLVTQLQSELKDLASE
jgi:hypothetical protein